MLMYTQHIKNVCPLVHRCRFAYPALLFYSLTLSPPLPRTCSCEEHGTPHFSYHKIAKHPDIIVCPESTEEVRNAPDFPPLSLEALFVAYLLVKTVAKHTCHSCGAAADLFRRELRQHEIFPRNQS